MALHHLALTLDQHITEELLNLAVHQELTQDQQTVIPDDLTVAMTIPDQPIAQEAMVTRDLIVQEVTEIAEALAQDHLGALLVIPEADQAVSLPEEAAEVLAAECLQEVLDREVEAVYLQEAQAQEAVVLDRLLEVLDHQADQEEVINS